MDQPTSRATADLLRRAEETLRARRGAEVSDLLEALEWCDLHGPRRFVDRAGTHVMDP